MTTEKIYAFINRDIVIKPISGNYHKPLYYSMTALTLTV